MSNELQSYRQPMVTAIGIILGFVLGFAADWATESTFETSAGDLIIVTALCSGSIFLMIALYRILSMTDPLVNSKMYYNRTLTLFIVGLGISFIGIFSSLMLIMI